MELQVKVEHMLEQLQADAPAEFREAVRTLSVVLRQQSKMA